MSAIQIESLEDHHECETCGFAYANGARVAIDGEFAFELTPHAHCFGGDDYSDADIFKAILQHIGHSLVFSTDDTVYEQIVKASGHSVEGRHLSPEQMKAGCREVIASFEADGFPADKAGVIYVFQKGSRIPNGFPRGKLYQSKQDGSRIYWFPAVRVLKWIETQEQAA